MTDERNLRKADLTAEFSADGPCGITVRMLREFLDAVSEAIAEGDDDALAEHNNSSGKGMR